MGLIANIAWLIIHVVNTNLIFETQSCCLFIDDKATLLSVWNDQQNGLFLRDKDWHTHEDIKASLLQMRKYWR